MVEEKWGKQGIERKTTQATATKSENLKTGEVND